MAKIEKPAPMSGFDIKTVCPAGQYAAVCLRITDLFGVERRKFQSEETEVKDVTRLLFGLIDAAGHLHMVQTYEYTISGAPGANLVKFLTAWLGRSPEYGWDYCELEGAGALLSVQLKETKSTPSSIYSAISGIAPLPAPMLPMMPAGSQFATLVAVAEAKSGAAASALSPGAPPVALPGASMPPVASTPPPALQAPPMAIVAPPVAIPFPPEGWQPHPENPAFFYKGNEVLSEADLRARSAPAVPQVPQVPSMPPVPGTPSFVEEEDADDVPF